MGDIVFLVELTPAECRRVADALANEPFSVVTYDRAERFLENVVAPISGCLLLPSDLPGIKARALIIQIRRRKLSLPIIVVGRNSDLAVAVELVRAGATDFLEQPFSHRDLRAMIRRAMRKIS